MALTRLGLPRLQSGTVKSYTDTLDALVSQQMNPAKFLAEELQAIRDYDPRYGTLISDIEKRYRLDGDIVRAELTRMYRMLQREGELPKLNADKMQQRWDATMALDPFIMQMNIGVNLSIIEQDNPEVFKMIIETPKYFMAPGYPRAVQQFLGTAALSDLSSGYMFLVDSVDFK